LTRRVGDKVKAPGTDDVADGKNADDEEEDEEEDECAICMGPIPKSLIFPSGSGAKANAGRKTISATLSTVTLLNCSHMFHDSCIANFEKFTPFNAKSCPVCRNTQNYHRRLLSKCCVGFEHSKKTKCHFNLNELFASSIEEVREAEAPAAPKAAKSKGSPGFAPGSTGIGSDEDDFELAIQQSLELHQAELEREYHQQLVELLDGDRQRSYSGNAEEVDHSAADSSPDEKEYSYSATPSFKFSGFGGERKHTHVSDRSAKFVSADLISMKSRAEKDKERKSSASSAHSRAVVATGKGTGKSSAFGDLLNRYK